MREPESNGETAAMAEQGERTSNKQAGTAEAVKWTTTAGEVAETGGRTTIGVVVVQKIAVTATREVPGVASLGGGMARAFGALRERIPGASAAQTSGANVEVGEKQTAIDLQITVDYGVSAVELARAVRRNVITAVERMTGLQVVEVNIEVIDILLPGEGEAAPARVE
ncbi:Asp23/Gls24 family envelope stress response protein [Saccharopolyspora shandongensis]|uniref:Asp23/Gls24 family envelope stress response protein n=1 Tax=Saccharopolyspora shandongensis TaxID=418495 RepID=UPI0033C2F869